MVFPKRIAERLYRRLFPNHARKMDALNAIVLRHENRKMQAALKQWNRCDDAARYLDENVRYFD